MERRSTFRYERRAVASVLLGSLLGMIGARDPVWAAAPVGKEKVWGAAELDLLMYVCGATGKGCPEKTKVVIAPARSIEPRLAAALAAIPRDVARADFGLDETRLTQRVDALRSKLEALYQRRAKFDASDITNQ